MKIFWWKISHYLLSNLFVGIWSARCACICLLFVQCVHCASSSQLQYLRFDCAEMQFKHIEKWFKSSLNRHFLIAFNANIPQACRQSPCEWKTKKNKSNKIRNRYEISIGSIGATVWKSVDNSLNFESQSYRIRSKFILRETIFKENDLQIFTLW